MYVIGLTGGIASGKSAVAAMLAEGGAIVVNADQVGWEVYRPAGPAYREVIAAFGPDILTADGSVDRKKLGAIVFADREALERLNAITHPRIKELLKERLADMSARGTEIVVLEAALLLEAGWQDLVDEVWVTVAPPEVAVQRLGADKGLSRQEALARIGAQLSNEERIQRAHVVINTDCPLAETRRIVEAEWSRLVTAGKTPSASKGV